MDESVHYLLLAAQGLFQRAVMGELSRAGLTAGQPKVLDYLGRHDGSMQKHIAAGCLIDPATLTGLLARMEERGLIRRSCREGDRRSVYVFLTAEGREKQALVRAAMTELEDRALAGLTAEDRAGLAAGLRRMCLALNGGEEGLQ